MKIVAFLQNQWYREPDKVEQTIRRTIDREHERGGKSADAVRDYYIASFLFMGCLTGRRLKEVFGDLCSEIVWQEQSPLVGGKSSAAFPADMDHIRESLRRHEPTHVLAFGKLASVALSSIGRERDWRLIVGPHPAARHATVIQELRAMREKLLTTHPAVV